MRKWNMPAIPLSSRMMNMILSPELRGAAIILGILSVMTFCTTFLLETNYNYYDLRSGKRSQPRHFHQFPGGSGFYPLEPEP